MTQSRLPWPLEAVLRAYPPAFRHAHGADIRDVIDTQIAAARESGKGTGNVYVAAWFDLLINLLPEWFASLRLGSRSSFADSFGRNFRFSLRRLLRTPGFTIASVLSLAVGVSAATMVFALVRTVLINPLPYPEADRLVAVWETRDGEEISVAWPNFRDWRESVTTAELAAYRRTNVNLTGDGPAQRLRGLQVTDNLFDVLEVSPVIGRAPTGAGEVVLTHSVWTTRYGADESVLGRTISLNAVAWIVVGVLPPGIEFPDGIVLGASDVFMPIQPTPGEFEDRGSHPGITAIGRLADGRSIDEMRAEMDALAQSLAETYPGTNAKSGVMMRDAIGVATGDLRRPLGFLAGAVGLLLLAAVGNVAGLGLTRTVSRAKEWGVRSALGANPRHVLGQVGMEYLVLGVVAIALGLWGSFMLLPRLATWPPVADTGLSGAVGWPEVMVGLGIGLIATLMVAAAPLVRALGASYTSVSGTRVTAPVRAREVLVASQLALATVLVVSAATLGRSMLRIYAEDGGIRPESTSVFRLSLPEAEYPTQEETLLFYRELQERLVGLPGVESVGGISTLPFSGAGAQSGILASEFPNAEPVRTDVNVVTVDYFATAGVELKQGRLFNSTDAAGAPVTVVVDERFANRMWPDGDPIGKKVIGWGLSGAEVVGVVGHVKNYGVTRESREELYMPHAQRAYLAMWVLMKSGFGSPPTATAIREVVAQIDPNIPVASVSDLEDIVAGTISATRLATALGLTLAGLIVFLALVGLRSTIAYSVQLRMREFGIRMALGSEAGQIRRGVLKRSLAVAGIGVGLGLLGARMTSTALQGLVFGIEASNLASYLAAAGLIGLIALGAGDGPARRAARCDPSVTLREE